MQVEKIVTTTFKHIIPIGKKQFTFVYGEQQTKDYILSRVASQLVYVDRDNTTNEILFYKKVTTTCDRGTGFYGFYFDFPEDEFTKTIDIYQIMDGPRENIVKLFYELLKHFKQD